MKILLLFPMADKQTGSAIKKAFENLGHHVKAVDAKLEPGMSYKVACEYKPDLIFCSRTVALTNQIIRIKQKMNVMACVWNVDTRTNINAWRHLFPLIRACDYYFTVASRLIPEWKKINNNTYWLPQGLQNETYNKPEIITELDRRRYSCDVCWAGDIGVNHEFRTPFINAIEQSGVDFKFWGCKGNPKIYDEEYNKMIALSKINIGCSGWPENRDCVSVRDYKIMGAGGFFLELYRSGLEELFPLNILAYYKNPEDMIIKIKYWLEHEAKRRIIAERGYKWIHENTTYTDRIKMALSYMGLR